MQEQLAFTTREALEACAVDESIEDTKIIESPKETVKIMDIPSSNNNTPLVVSINSKKIPINGDC